MSCTDSFYQAIYCVLFDSIQESVFSLISLNIQKLKKILEFSSHLLRLRFTAMEPMLFGETMLP